MNNVTLTDVLVFEALEAGFKLEIAKLREFFEAATAHGVEICATHDYKCCCWPIRGKEPDPKRYGGTPGPCSCGGYDRQARIEKALSALSEDDGSEASA